MAGNREELLFALGQAAVDAVEAVKARSKTQEEPVSDNAFPSTHDPAFDADAHDADALAHSITVTLSPLFEGALPNDIPMQHRIPPDTAHQDNSLSWEEEFRLSQKGDHVLKDYQRPEKDHQISEMPHQNADRSDNREKGFHLSEEDAPALEEDYSPFEGSFPSFETSHQNSKNKHQDVEEPINWEKEFRLLENDYQALEADYQALEEDYKLLAENYHALEDDYRTLDEKVTNLEAQLAQACDRTHKQNEDFENYRKRIVREQEKERCQREAKLALDFIGIMDNFERAIAHTNPCCDFSSLLQGVGLVGKMFLAKLAKYGCVPFDSLGATFDPRQHDVLSRVVDEEAPHNVIVQEHLKGYIMHDRVLRPALVVVSQNAYGDEDVIGE